MFFPDRFPFVPKPQSNIFYQFGIHPVVCCPQKLNADEICFESDPHCPNYKPPDYEYDYEEYENHPVTLLEKENEAALEEGKKVSFRKECHSSHSQRGYGLPRFPS